MPELSIVTINYNNSEGLRETFKSVFAQTFSNFEYIVIDGGSDDESKELIKKNVDKITYWVSEKDEGIYNAMNKGIAKASGNYLLFLNSGDWLYSKDAISKIFECGGNADIIYGNIILKNGMKEEVWSLPDLLGFNFFLNSSLPHSFSFIKRSLFNRYGYYNEEHKIVSDWEFFLLAIHKYQCSYRHVSIIGAVFNMDGISTSKVGKQLLGKERTDVLEKNFGSFLWEYKNFEKLSAKMKQNQGKLLIKIHNKVTSVLKNRKGK